MRTQKMRIEMYRLSIYLTIAALFTGVSVLIMSGCDMFGNPDEKAPAPHQFSFEVSDESGEVLKRVTDKSIDDIEIETSLGLFGEYFTPPEIADFIREQYGAEPDLSRHEIWLHSEHGVGEDAHFVTLNFDFPRMDGWNAGTYPVDARSQEEWLELLRNIWEVLREHRNEGLAKANLPAGTNHQQIEDQSVRVNYHESGFGNVIGFTGSLSWGDLTEYLYLPTGGYLELENMTRYNAEGKFSIEMAALSGEVMSFDNEEFPEDPEFRMYRITGDFVAEYGDYHDLMEARADLISGYRERNVTFTPGQ
jgi:hypothetical protein